MYNIVNISSVVLKCLRLLFSFVTTLIKVDGGHFRFFRLFLGYFKFLPHIMSMIVILMDYTTPSYDQYIENK